MKTTNDIELISYIATPRRTTSEPVKIDAILEARMRAFLRARRVRRWMSAK
ncbi:MAG: hypothetical protein JWO54_640 [Candidatus Saccharibacteria bacterium]|nr:hypothetical protein [Candidatus Saccharibacteria bacterium]MDB5180880.1 hypothetical protein [Candidatus Saccharibacteria bacterium]